MCSSDRRPQARPPYPRRRPDAPVAHRAHQRMRRYRRHPQPRTMMAATHCKHGHEWTTENTFINVRGIRECRTCGRERKKAWKRANPNSERRYKSQPTSVVCPDCGDERTISRSRAGGAGKNLRCPTCATKRAAAKLRKGRYVNCEMCGNRFWLTPSRAPEARFCSRACAYKSPSRTEKLRDREGPKNPGFRHGLKAGNNIRGWSVADKGETCCRICGSTRWLHLHHIIPRGKCRASRRDLRNGMSLCNSCHMKWHRRSLTIPREAMTAEEWSYVSSVQLTGERIEDWLDRYYPPRLLIGDNE